MEKKILLISYENIKFDGRLRTFFEILPQIGVVYTALRGVSVESERHKEVSGHYLKYIKETISYAKEIKNIDILFIDNRKACVPGFIIGILLKPKVIIQDCRELYISQEIHHVSGKIGCVAESLMMRKSHIIIAANRYRAEIMRKIHKLKKEPLVFENIRSLKYENDEAKRVAGNMLGRYICDNEYRIIATSGCDLLRMTDILVRSMKKVNYRYRLLLVGQDTGKDVDAVKSIIEDENILSVTIIGKLDQNQLKYLIKNSHIGIVNYNQIDTNNKFCASGKLYEFIYEGIPVVTTTNPTLKDICDQKGIGISDDEFYSGINNILDNYETYRKNVDKFIKEHPIKAAQDELIETLLKEMDGIC